MYGVHLEDGLEAFHETNDKHRFPTQMITSSFFCILIYNTPYISTYYVLIIAQPNNELANYI